MRQLGLLRIAAKLARGSTFSVIGFWAVLTALFLTPVAARGQQWGGQSANHDTIRKYPIGTSVQVHLRNKHTITGHVEKYAGDGFWIKAEGQGPRGDQKLFYVEIKAIDPKKSGGEAAIRSGQPRFGLDFSVGGADASIRVYRPKESEDSGEQH